MRTPRRQISLGSVVALAIGVLLAACSNDGDTSVTRTVPTMDSVPTSSITVFAASSLTEASERLGAAFQAERPGAAVSFAFGGSSELAAQILQGAPVDAFASADQPNMAKVVDGGEAAGTPVVFARNTMEIIVAAGNPNGIGGLADLANPDLIVLLGAAEVPAGAYAATVLSNAGVTVTPKSYEASVKAIVAKVTAGEADAGIVFATDVRAAGSSAAGVEIPADVNVIAEFPIVAIATSANAPTATAFIEFLLSSKGQEILTTAGFLPA